MAELISVIVATYNRVDALDACLRGFSRQGDRQFEVIVADDGSRADTMELVANWRGRIGVPLTHVWHEDSGFRLAEIRNRAILASRGATCVFVDGDCIPCRDYVAAHRALAEPGWFVAGNRALLSGPFTEKVLRDHLEPERWGAVRWLAACMRGDINRLAPLLRLPLGPLRKLQPANWRSARGGNLAIRRDDLERVDGFDAAFSGWGREDSDIVLRLMRAGVRRKDGRFATGVLHLWHPESDRSRLPGNDARLDEVMRGDRIRARAGLTALAATDIAGAPDSARAVR
ncbi:MAG: family 2 glycosyl transferase [Xanthobacteraceae bacterium]|nr:family 2 glycosyl transferase [Xanthobacteraceae bacterium]